MRSLLCTLFLLVQLAPAQTQAERKWLAKYLQADSKEAAKLLKRFPGGGKPSRKRLSKLFAAGPQRKKMEAGIHHLSFKEGEEEWKYTISLPPGYDLKKRYPLVIDTGHISMKESGEEQVAQALMNYVRQTDGKLIAVRPRIFDRMAREGRYSNPEQQVTLSVPAFRGLLRELRIRFAVDPERVFLTGISMAGFWAWRLGAALSGDLAGIIPLAAVTHQVRYGWENLRNLNIHVVHAKDDPTCLFKFAEEAVAKLEPLGTKIETTFLEQGGHLAPFRHFGAAWNSLGEARRARNPETVFFAWQSPREWGLVHGLEVTKGRKAKFVYPRPSGHVRLEREGQRITLSSESAQEVVLWLEADALNLKKPLQIKAGKQRLTKRVKFSAKAALEAVRRTGDLGRLRGVRVSLRL